MQLSGMRGCQIGRKEPAPSFFEICLVRQGIHLTRALYLRQQFLRQNLSCIDGVIWTHGHYDHYSGFGEFYWVQNKVHVYGIPETLDYINQYVSFLKPRYHHVKLCEPFELIGLQFTLFNYLLLWRSRQE